MFSPATIPVKVGAASGPRNVEEEEQILEAQLVPILLSPSRGIRPAPDDSLAVSVPFVGADEWKQRHCITGTSGCLAHNHRESERVRSPAGRGNTTHAERRSDRTKHPEQNSDAPGRQTRAEMEGAPDATTRSASARAPSNPSRAARAIDSPESSAPHRPRAQIQRASAARVGHVRRA